MTNLIFIIALLIEIGFAAYCMKTHSNQKKIHNLLRISVLILFILMTLVSVLQWGFRYLLFAALLLIWAVIAIISLLRKKEDKKNFSTPGMIFKRIGALVLILVTLIPAFLFPQYKLPKMTGTHEIATALYTYTDPERIETFDNNGSLREINVEFWYPADISDRESCPLVVFSHGAFGIKISNTSTFMELASNGYVVCSIDHPYHSMMTTNADGKTTIIDQTFLEQSIGINTGKYTEEEIYQFQKDCMSVRVPDMNLAVAEILKQHDLPDSDMVYQLVNPEHIGLFGHSMGGAASAQLARERDDIDCVISLEGTMMGEYVDFKDGKEVINSTPYPVPILNVYTDNVMTALEKYPDYEFVNRTVSATAPASFEVYLKGTNHMSLTDLSLVSPFLVNMILKSADESVTTSDSPRQTIEQMNDAILNFFDCYLKNKGTFTMEGTY